jgi:hypothetical protein
VLPIIGGLSIAVEKLVSAIPYDFSHLRIYVDGLLDGTITKVPGIWIAAPLDPLTAHTVQVTAVNQSGKESAKSAAITATPLKVVDEIALGEIDETLIADDSISTPKLQALAITAAKIAANAIEATHIKAGAVTAEKLTALIVLAQKRLIVGNQTGKRVELNDNGLEQYSELGKLLVQMSAGSVAGNIWTVVDPNNEAYALATLDSQGGLAVEALAVNTGEAYFNGRSLDELIENRPRGIQARAGTPLTAYTTGKIGICEVSAQIYPGRLYRVRSGNLTCQTSDGGYGWGTLFILGTVDGTKPTVNSGYYVYGYIVGSGTGYGTSSSNGGFTNAGTGDTGGHYHLYSIANHSHQTATSYNNQNMQLEYIFPGAAQEYTISLLLMYDHGWGASSRAIGTTSGESPQLYIEDVGPNVNATGGVNVGDGSGSVAVRYSRTYQCSYTKVWQSGVDNPSFSNLLQQGGPQGFRSTMGFNHSLIRTDLNGATIERVELYLYANSWKLNTGGFAVIGTHNINDSLVPTYSTVTKGVKVQKMVQPEGRWIELPILVGDQLKANVIKGLVLDASSDATPLADQYFGSFDHFTSPINAKAPLLRITYRK